MSFINKIKLLTIFSAGILFFSGINGVSAAVVASKNFDLLPGKADKVFELGKDFKLIFDLRQIKNGSAVEMSQLKEKVVAPKGGILVSDIFQLDFLHSKKLKYAVKIAQSKSGEHYKKIYYLDKNRGAWMPLPSRDLFDEKAVLSQLDFPFVRLAVFEFTDSLTVGKASWYNYKGGLFAASPDFPLGTTLRVTNLADKSRSVDVVVNDFGPNRIKHPERAIDLDREAYAYLAKLGTGVIDVRVEPVNALSKAIVMKKVDTSVSVDNSGKKTLAVAQTNSDLKLTSGSGIVINAKTGAVIWSKNSNQLLPLASLSKIVAMKVFLDTKPNLNKVVEYSIADEKKNYVYAGKGSVARLHVTDGETMTVRNLLYAALLGSANNSVETLVRVSGLTRAQFMSRMNKYAVNAGAKNTHFEEPTGLSPNNVSSAKDYAMISRKALQDGNLAHITSTKEYRFSTINTKQPHLIKNTNKLKYWSNLTITGSKTGYLDEAQYCLMTRAKSSKGEVLAVTFATPEKNASFNETKTLIEYGFSHLK